MPFEFVILAILFLCFQSLHGQCWNVIQLVLRTLLSWPAFSFLILSFRPYQPPWKWYASSIWSLDLHVSEYPLTEVDIDIIVAILKAVYLILFCKFYVLSFVCLKNKICICYFSYFRDCVSCLLYSILISSPHKHIMQRILLLWSDL